MPLSGYRNSENSISKIEEFIKYCESCSLEKQQNISLFLLEIIYRNQEIHTLISDPLKKYLVKIMQFRASSQGESLAYQWLDTYVITLTCMKRD